MAHYTIEEHIINEGRLPSFSLTINDSGVTVIHSNGDMQSNLIDDLRGNGRMTVFDQQEGLYERLTVQDHIIFFRKWFGCQVPVPEILVQFALQHCARKPLHRCSESEVRRVYFAKYYMSAAYPMVFREPVHGADVETINVFMDMTAKLLESGTPVLVLVSNMEHALLLGDIAYKLQENSLRPIEIEDGDGETETESIEDQTTTDLFKIPAKVDDKTILFNPQEIDYIESQEGKATIVIDDEAYAMEATLTDMERKLEAYGFYRCHRSYIVNLQKVREIITWSKNTYSLRIDNPSQSTIPLSRTKVQDIREKFSL